MIMEIELQSQVLDAINYVLYDQLKFKGNRMDYYNALNLYMHQVHVAAARGTMQLPPPPAAPSVCSCVGTVHCLNLHVCTRKAVGQCWGVCDLKLRKGGCVGSVPVPTGSPCTLDAPGCSDLTPL